MLLKLKRNSFNSNHSTSSISIQEYAFCEDLGDEFAAAANPVKKMCKYTFVNSFIYITYLVILCAAII